MKLRNKLAIIMATAMLAFSGVGYAAWTFTAERTAQVTTIEDKVAVGIELTDNFKLYNASGNAEVSSLYLICDAPAGESGVLDGDGVYWATDNAGANAISNVYIKGTLTKVQEDGVKDNKDTVTVQFGASHNFTSTYIDFGAITAPANINVSVANNAEVKSANFALPSVDYLVVPTSTAELTAMNTALASELSGATLSLSAQIIA